MEKAIYYYLIITCIFGTYTIVTTLINVVARIVFTQQNQQDRREPVTATPQIDKKYRVNKKAIENYLTNRYRERQATQGLHELTSKYHRR